MKLYVDKIRPIRWGGQLCYRFAVNLTAYPVARFYLHAASFDKVLITLLPRYSTAKSKTTPPQFKPPIEGTPIEFRFYPNVTFGSYYRKRKSVRQSVVCLSVCNVRAPYSAGRNFPQYFYIFHPSHPLTSVQNLVEIVPGKLLRRGLNAKGVTKYSDVDHVEGYISETVQYATSDTINWDIASNVNKDWTHKDQDKDKDQSHEDKDKD